jgi:hypothetical protein
MTMMILLEVLLSTINISWHDANAIFYVSKAYHAIVDDLCLA